MPRVNVTHNPGAMAWYDLRASAFDAEAPREPMEVAAVDTEAAGGFGPVAARVAYRKLDDLALEGLGRGREGRRLHVGPRDGTAVRHRRWGGR